MKLAKDRKKVVLDYTEVVMANWDKMSPPDLCPEKTWVPKNEEISFQVKDEKEMTAEFWGKVRFPHRPIPTEVYTHVKVEVWDSQIDLLAERNVADM